MLDRCCTTYQHVREKKRHDQRLMRELHMLLVRNQTRCVPLILLFGSLMDQTFTNTGVPGPADTVPLHTVHLEEFLPELQALIAHFHLPHDPQNVRTTADEMELFSTVTLSNELLTRPATFRLVCTCFNGVSRSECVSSGVEGVQDGVQTTGADEDVSSVRRVGGQTEPVGKDERRPGCEEGGRLDPLHSGGSQQTGCHLNKW